MPVVVLVGTLDTKGPELRFLRDRLRELGASEVVLVDCGIRSTARDADITAVAVAAAAGERRSRLADAPDRGAAVTAMARGVAAVVTRLRAEGRLDAIVGVGGSSGSAMIAPALQELPVGVPKLLVTTMASGDTRPYVGTSDIALLYPIVDIAGLNTLSERILSNAAGAIVGMASAAQRFRPRQPARPVVAATMYGVTTPCVEAARAWLEEHGYEVLVFHATGPGGQAMEALVRAGHISGVLDITPTELTDELVGGAFSAGPERLEAAGAVGIPQVVALGAAEIATFGPPPSVPKRYRQRRLLAHNDNITLMRIDAGEAAQLGRLLARKLNAARGPVSLFLTDGGFSSLSTPGADFHDAVADRVLIDTLVGALEPHVGVVRSETDLNDPVVGRAMAEQLHAFLEQDRAGPEPDRGRC